MTASEITETVEEYGITTLFGGIGLGIVVSVLLRYAVGDIATVIIGCIIPLVAVAVGTGHRDVMQALNNE